MQILPRQRTERGSLRPDPGCEDDLLRLHCLVLRDNLYLYFEFIANISNILYKYHIDNFKNVGDLTTVSLYSYGAISSWTGQKLPPLDGTWALQFAIIPSTSYYVLLFKLGSVCIHVFIVNGRQRSTERFIYFRIDENDFMFCVNEEQSSGFDMQPTVLS